MAGILLCQNNVLHQKCSVYEFYWFTQQLEVEEMVQIRSDSFLAKNFVKQKMELNQNEKLVFVHFHGAYIAV